MNKQVEKIIEEYFNFAEEYGKFFFLARDAAYQRKAVFELSKLLADVYKGKNVVIEQEDEPAANQLLAVQCLINSQRFELKMLIDMKNSDWHAAWNAMVDAQDYSSSAESAADLPDDFNLSGHAHKLDLYEKVFFPPQMFSSPSIIVDNFLCSICDENYASCDHIAGKSYWGRFCQRVVDDIVDVQEVSLVDNPADKKARLYEFITDDKMIRDRLTWTKREPDEDDEETMEQNTDGDMVIRTIAMTPSDSQTDFREYFPESMINEMNTE